MRRPRTIDDVALLTDLAAAGGDPEPIQIRLRDGTLAILRPISAGDKGRLQRGCSCSRCGRAGCAATGRPSSCSRSGSFAT
jgi:hypothetical protein